MKHILSMRTPSSWWRDLWREGLPVGNGFTGANLYGGAKKEILQLNRHDLWYDGKDTPVPDVHEKLAVMREKMDAGAFREASWEIVNALREAGYASALEAHIPAARMIVEQDAIGGFEEFSRTLDLERALAQQKWVDGGIEMRRQAFVSRQEDLVLYRLLSDAQGADLEKVVYKISLEAYKNDGEKPNPAIEKIWAAAKTQAQIDKDGAYLYFASTREKPDGSFGDFGAVAKITADAGSMTIQNGRLWVRGAKEVCVRIALFVDVPMEKAWADLKEKLAQNTQSFEEMLEKSAEKHRALYHSAELSLGEKWETDNELMTMDAFHTGRQSRELIEKLWHFGRYLFICGTDPKANPFPLYGLWPGAYHPQWCHNMANENLQMIYWHCFAGNLLQQHQAVFAYMNDRIGAFEENAQKLFGLDGIYMTAGTTPGVSSPTQVVPVIINWVGAAGWIAQHYWKYYEYTRDAAFAKEVLLPYMDGVARFYEGFVRFEGEKLRFYPSVSPENTPVNFMPPEGVHMAHPMPTTINATIDLEILKEFFTNMLALQDVLKAQGEAGFDEARIALWEKILCGIPSYRVNKDGAICEWQEEIFEDRYDHRHLSHIYPVFPGQAVYAKRDPQKIDAYIRAVKLRKIDAQTGWSMAHMAAIYARFLDGASAMRCLDNMAKSCLTNNLFSLHNDWRGMNISLTMDPAPVQLDAIMGYVNAVQEMLFYAAPGYLALLPALEERLNRGSIAHFRFDRGEVSLRWDAPNGLFEATVTPFESQEIEIELPAFVRSPIFEGAQAQRLTDTRWRVQLTDRPCTILAR